MTHFDGQRVSSGQSIRDSIARALDEGMPLSIPNDEHILRLAEQKVNEVLTELTLKCQNPADKAATIVEISQWRANNITINALIKRTLLYFGGLVLAGLAYIGYTHGPTKP